MATERPEVSEAAEELYAALGPFARIDADTGWTLLNFCAALVSSSTDRIHEIVTDSETGPGWQILLDPLNTPEWALPYLAQYVGAHLTPDMSIEQQREAIATPEGFGRGTISAITAVAKRRLTGSKAVVITERYTNSAWRLRIETLEAETPEPARTKAEIIAEQKPIGIVFFFNTRAGWTWGELLAESALYPTWKSVREAFATWYGVRTHEP